MDEPIRDVDALADEYLAFVERLLKFIVGGLLLSLVAVVIWRAGTDDGD